MSAICSSRYFHDANDRREAGPRMIAVNDLGNVRKKAVNTDAYEK